MRWNSIQIVYNDYHQWQISLACLSLFPLTASCLFHAIEAEKENTYKELILLSFNYMSNNTIKNVFRKTKQNKTKQQQQQKNVFRTLSQPQKETGPERPSQLDLFSRFALLFFLTY